MLWDTATSDDGGPSVLALEALSGLVIAAPEKYVDYLDRLFVAVAKGLYGYNRALQLASKMSASTISPVLRQMLSSSLNTKSSINLDHLSSAFEEMQKESLATVREGAMKYNVSVALPDVLESGAF